jgi:hypothetical protein
VESVKCIVRVPTLNGPVGTGTATALVFANVGRTAATTSACAVNPVPVKLICCGLSVLLSETEMLAVRVPVEVGVNVTEMVQEIPTPTLAPQVFC